MKKFLVLPLLAILVFCVVPSCKTVESLDGMSIVTSDWLISPESLSNPDVVIIPNEILPIELVQSERFKGKNFVLAPDALIKLDAPKIDFSPEDKESWILNFLGLAVSVSVAFFPKLAVLEALFLLLSKRKREHYAAAATSLLPFNGSLDVKAAALSVVKALGILHTDVPTPVAAVGCGGEPTPAKVGPSK